MIMVQKLHSVRLLVLYDSMHIRFHMACFAIQTHPESTQSLVIIFLEGGNGILMEIIQSLIGQPPCYLQSADKDSKVYIYSLGKKVNSTFRYW